MAVHGSLWKTRQELTWTAVTTRSKVTKFQKGLSLSPLVQLSRSSEVTELLPSASCCCFWLKAWLTVSQSEKQSPLCPQANFVQVCPMSSRNPFFNLMWLPGSGLCLSCGQGEANHSTAWEKSVLLAESRLINIAKQVWDEDVLQEWGPCFELGGGLKYTPQQGQKHLLGFFWRRRIAERQRVLTTLQACIFPLNTFTARIWKAEAGHVLQIPLGCSAKSHWNSPFMILFHLQQKKTRTKIQELHMEALLWAGKEEAMEELPTPPAVCQLSVPLPLLLSLLNQATDGSSWFLKGFYFLISIFHVLFESGTIPFSSEEETLCWA